MHAGGARRGTKSNKPYDPRLRRSASSALVPDLLSHLTRPCFVALAAVVVLAVGSTSASAGPTPSLRGDHHASVGLTFTLVGSGLTPGNHVSPFVVPIDGRDCCGIAITQTRVVPASGSVRFTFRWPALYYRCPAATRHHCSRTSWRRGQGVLVGLDAPEMHPLPSAASQAEQHVLMKARVRAVGHSGSRAQATAAGPVDPLPGTGMSLDGCHNPWMTAAGTLGAGVGADISFAPTDRARYLGRFTPDAVWANLQGCAPFPYLTNDEQDSMYEQMLCHLEGGVLHFGGSTFDFEAWRPIVPASASLATARCNPDLGPGGGIQYLDQLVQWSGDPHGQKTAWLVARDAHGTLQRRWIPTTQIYGCLKRQGKQGPIELDHSFILRYLAAAGPSVQSSETCGQPATPAPPGTPSTPPPGVGTPAPPLGAPPGPPPSSWAETPGGVTHTWTNYTNAGGYEGPQIPAYQTVQVACKLPGFAVADGDTWWYRIASSPWNGEYYASADAFYNNGQTSGSLHGTPFVDGAVADC